MTSLIWYIILVKMVICSESDSSSSDSSSSDSKEYDTLFDGEYTSADFAGFHFSICTAENGNIYGAGGPSFIGADSIARNTEGVLQVSDGVYQVEFDVFQFAAPGTGVTQYPVTITYYESTDKTTILFGADPASTLNKTADKGERCIIPDGNWNDAIEDFPFNVALQRTPNECPEGVSNCGLGIVRFENASMDVGGCWARYDYDKKAFVNFRGDALINTQIMWDGEVMIFEWNVYGEDFCAVGTSIIVWTIGEEEYTELAKCADTAGWSAKYLRDADVLKEIEDATCPLYVDSSAKTMFRNDDENGYK
eukprot:713822_1